MPVVLALHGAAINGPMTAYFCGLNKKADESGFVAMYPHGTGSWGMFLVWNAGGMAPKERPDDVAFIRKLLDDLGSVVKIDPKRVCATGMSNGGMMCYRLAAELSDRITANQPNCPANGEGGEQVQTPYDDDRFEELAHVVPQGANLPPDDCDHPARQTSGPGRGSVRLTRHAYHSKADRDDRRRDSLRSKDMGEIGTGM